MQDLVEQHLTTDRAEFQYSVQEGSPSEEILKIASSQKVDLIFLMNHVDVQGRRFFRISPISRMQVYGWFQRLRSFSVYQVLPSLQLMSTMRTPRLAYGLDEAKGFNLFV